MTTGYLSSMQGAHQWGSENNRQVRDFSEQRRANVREATSALGQGSAWYENGQSSASMSPGPMGHTGGHNIGGYGREDPPSMVGARSKPRVPAGSGGATADIRQAASFY